MSDKISTIKVNGKIYEISQDISVSEFLKGNGFNIEYIAVERDGEILPRLFWESSDILDGCIYEIVEFVGGG